ncbi:uncharacterized protein BP5553_00936 [Venustampulla echinocandica]|uniref:Uncharacterized protein n=1 Tax=Venustampulla echinocandica TaxID=2656787 RepID=A0A370TZK5_9HELO|nr:uncharacterized protein BP5553_00936 [Venustampulla echinocandica]RDL40957.1 hypothetical protein BP5553_00936 [Venustampulla echinocandica]
MPFSRLALLNLVRPRLGPNYRLNHSRRRLYHDAKATLFDPRPGAGPISKAVEIKIGDLDEAYVIVAPEIGSILAGRPLPDGTAVEVPLTFFHRTKHFAIGS